MPYKRLQNPLHVTQRDTVRQKSPLTLEVENIFLAYETEDRIVGLPTFRAEKHKLIFFFANIFEKNIS